VRSGVSLYVRIRPSVYTNKCIAALQHTAAHCNTPQHAALHETPKCTLGVPLYIRIRLTVYTNEGIATLQHTATHRNTSQHAELQETPKCTLDVIL